MSDVSDVSDADDVMRLVVLASGGGTNLQAILDACAEGRIDGEVALVVSDRAEAGALTRAAGAGVAGRHLPVAGRARGGYDAELAEVVADAAPDVVVLAGWMRILSATFLDRFPGRVVNLHPALPGELAGTRAIERAWAEHEAGHRRRSGVMVHLVPDEAVDAGPVLAAETVPIHPDDTYDRFAARVHAAEHRILVGVLAAWAAGPVPLEVMSP